MSFASDVKTELLKAELPAHAEAAYYGALLLFGRHFSVHRISLLTENPQAAEAYARAVRFFTGMTPPVDRTDGGNYKVALEDTRVTESILAEAGYAYPHTARRIRFESLDDPARRICFLRGAFIVCGTVTDPDKEYHLEFACSSAALAEDLASLLRTQDISPGAAIRGGSRIVYIKNSEQIADLLAELGAPENAMTVMGAKMYKDVRNTINRKVNFENANIARSIAAASRQYEAIRRIRELRGLDALPQELRVVAEARLQNRELGTAELAALLPGELSVSGVNHRFRRIQKIADTLTEEDKRTGGSQ